jgi:hypothetical protein
MLQPLGITDKPRHHHPLFSPFYRHRRQLNPTISHPLTQVHGDPLSEGQLTEPVISLPDHQSTTATLLHRRRVAPSSDHDAKLPLSLFDAWVSWASSPRLCRTSWRTSHPRRQPPSSRRLMPPRASPLSATVSFHCELVPKILSGEAVGAQGSSLQGHVLGLAAPGSSPTASWPCAVHAPPKPGVPCAPSAS